MCGNDKFFIVLIYLNVFIMLTEFKQNKQKYVLFIFKTIWINNDLKNTNREMWGMEVLNNKINENDIIHTKRTKAREDSFT